MPSDAAEDDGEIEHSLHMVELEECAECGGHIDPTEPGHYKSADDETFVHSVCLEEDEPSKVLDLLDEHPFTRQGARQYGCGHYAHGPPADLPEECPECEVPAP